MGRAYDSAPDDPSEMMAQLILRMRALAELDDRYGGNRGRDAERRALVFALDQLGADFGDQVAEQAAVVADHHAARIARNRAARAEREGWSR